MRVSFYTLGCKVNQNESGAMAQLFEANGYTVVPAGEEADVYIVNSCTVTNFGDQKSRKWLRRAKRENPGAVTVLTGCYPQAFPKEAAEIAEADVVTGSGSRRILPELVRKVLDGEEQRIVEIQPHHKGEQFEELPIERFAEHTRAFVKVEDGCNRQCAYCVIPRARGPVRSRSEESVLQELTHLAAAGYKEVVLSAISLPSYGMDTGTCLADLLEKASQVEGIERIRLGSLDPDNMFATNHQQTAEENGWSVTDADYSIKTVTFGSNDGLLTGLHNGLSGVRTGEICYILFSGQYGFGKRQVGAVPANSALLYEIRVESVSNR